MAGSQADPEVARSSHHSTARRRVLHRATCRGVPVIVADLISIDLPDAERQLPELVRRVEATGEGYVVLERGRPMARLLPPEERSRERPAGLTPEQQAALARLLSLTSAVGLDKFDREEIYNDRADELDRRRDRAR